ncbi:adhesion G-protein coupled receptor G6-like isoform X2 [Zerene cesonia]|uniref:adhesion G-protein coupled receptor G6-like isoform X2 n=1 Tax=Zerene cesonia TaxID=33412 RepID=UPI0018E58712|nr:adhesion G-protein coupled receptor G6-like isoform X2 [Zerene cesonia]
MHLNHLLQTTVVFIALSCICKSVYGKKIKKYTCPIGFSIAYTTDKGHPICYRLKGPEKFTDQYKDCVGNLYTSKLYLALNFTSPNIVLWTEFKSLYAGGTFVDWSYTKTMGSELDSSFEVNIDPTIDTGEGLCVAINPISNFTAVKCTDNYYRYCFLKPYPDEDEVSDTGCDGLRDAVRFWSPESTCLTVLTGVGGGTVRATWKQAQDLCAKRGGSLLNRGWRYSNNPMFHESGFNNTYPLGMIMSSDLNTLRYDSTNDQSEIPNSDWNFEDNCNNSDTLFGAIRDDLWYLVNGSYIFFDVICERNVPIKNLSMLLDIDLDNKVTLTVNNSITSDRVYCYTDSVLRYPTKVGKRKKEDTNTFVIKPERDGYYWCTHVDVRNYHVAESNKKLFIREKESLDNVYAVLLRHYRKIKLDIVEKLTRIWEVKLKEYIYLRTKYESVFGEMSTNRTEEVLKSFKESNPGLDLKEKIVVQKLNVKRLYLDAQTVLLHVELNPEYKPATPGLWDGIKIVFMKPVYYCKGFDSVPSAALGESVTSAGCRTHSCIGDFNEGVQWVTSATDNCFTRTPVEVDTEVQFSTELRHSMPTPKPSKPDQVLQQVMQDLDNLINNDSVPIFVDDIGDIFNQVDHLLEDSDNLEIPGQFLHLLDRLGSSIELNGSKVVTAVRSNIALVMANAEPDNPVRGIRIATRQDDSFNNDAFEVFNAAPNNTALQSDESEAVVVLPGSISDTMRRVSFVVFRNDRAFQDTNMHHVNSRVLSIKVENLTKFENGEVIDIHLSPLSANITRNQSRTCGYWQFLDDGTGFWSQEGCTFIRSKTGQLDTCRCTHLTHFAEILVPRAVFPEHHENILELLTVIGCCLSLFGLALVAVTAIMFRSWRRDFSNKIWLQLCIAIFLLALSFLIVIFARFAVYNVPCMIIGIVLHYSVLASFCWMLVAAVLSYRRLVLVFTRDASHKLLRASAFSWGIPLAIVGILLSVAPNSYAGRFEEKTPSGSFCYPSGIGLWVTVFAPIGVVILVNWTLFFLIVRSVFASRRIQRHGDSNEALRCASVSCLLVFLFGLPWIFGLFAANIVAAYLFTLTASYQGFILFLFFVIGNKKTRDLWLNKLKIKQTRKVPVTSSTYSNRSTAWRPNTSTIETKVSKPKSLSTPDDSRFS